MTGWWRRLPAVLGLTVVWIGLWGELTPTIVVGGLLVAAAVTVLFPVPLLEPLPFRPWQVLRLLGYVLLDLVRGAAGVGWQVLRHGPRARAGIVAVPMLTRSGRVASMIAGALALAPGSFVLQLDQRRGVWYVYALGLTSAADAHRVRAQVDTMQRRVIAAFGNTEDLRRCADARPIRSGGSA